MINELIIKQNDNGFIRFRSSRIKRILKANDRVDTLVNTIEINR